MAGLQKYPDLAEELMLPFPQVDVQTCTMCGDCAKACTVHAMELDSTGRVLIEPTYCVNCGACAVACPEGAISMVAQNAEELVVPDEKAKERERQRKRSQKLREQGKQTLERGLDLIEGLADDE
jgi:ferredoxin